MNKKIPKSRLYEFDERNLLNLRKIAVVGDLHGDYYALSSLQREVDPAKDGIIFLGDYADRGLKGVEVINTIDSLVKKYPRNVVALKGNHEDYSDSGNPIFRPCDLINEVEEKEGNWQGYFEKKLKPFIDDLYLAAIIRDKVLFVHGGVSRKIRSINDLRYPTRDIEIDVLWSDPFEEQGELPNMRGVGVEFGKDVTCDVCNSLGVKRIMRSHEPIKAIDGPYYEHDTKVMTISSSSVYGGKPLILIIDPNNPVSTSSHFL